MNGRRKLVLLVALLLAEELPATASEPFELDDLDEPGVLQGEEVHRVVTVQSAVPAAALAVSLPQPERALAPSSHYDLKSVTWTVGKAEPVQALATRWGVRTDDLVALNPQLQGRASVQPGEHWVVHREDPAEPTKSIGAPNKGRLRNGLPLPESDRWQFRPTRRRSFGARNTIVALIDAMERYGDRYPDAAPIRMGELSGRTGGRARPHKSHRTGRDVDIGYVLHDPPAEGWRRATPRDFDVERNWALVEELVATGEVQQIYISAGLQKLLYAHAAQTLSPEELAVYFWMPGGGSQQSPILKHQNGHRDHLHVRFRCEPDNHRCRSQSVGRKGKHSKKT